MLNCITMSKSVTVYINVQQVETKSIQGMSILDAMLRSIILQTHLTNTEYKLFEISIMLFQHLFSFFVIKSEWNLLILWLIALR